MRTSLRAAAGGMVTFPSRPRSAAQDAARLRDNQRRHRARVKAHIAELEVRLAETDARLDAALAEVDRLTTEVETLRRAQVAGQPASSGPARSAPESGAEPRAAPPPPSDHADQSSYPLCRRPSSGGPNVPRTPPAARSSGSATAARPPAVLSPPIQDEQPPPQGSGNTNPQDQPHPDSEVDTAQPDTPVVVMLLRSCDGLPAPHSGESTMTCTDAYRVIKEQNFSGLDVAAITNWLKPGFRGATVQGGGCRVDTQLLFALLDHISSGDGGSSLAG